jgi:hypothetical protein
MLKTKEWKWVTGPEAGTTFGEDSLVVQLSQIISPFGMLTTTSITELKKIMLTHLVLEARFLE